MDEDYDEENQEDQILKINWESFKKKLDWNLRPILMIEETDEIDNPLFKTWKRISSKRFRKVYDWKQKSGFANLEICLKKLRIL